MAAGCGDVMAAPLSRAMAAAFPGGVAPLWPGAAPEPDIVHLGVGAFHRAHQAVLTERGMAATDDRSSGIVGVAHRSRGVVNTLTRQDGRFTILDRDGRHDGTAHVVNAFASLVHAPTAADVVAAIAAGTSRVVTLTVNEVYLIDPLTGGLRDDGVVRVDVVAVGAGEAPSIAVGLLATGLLRRADQGGPPGDIPVRHGVPACPRDRPS